MARQVNRLHGARVLHGEVTDSDAAARLDPVTSQ
jgi:hypothetical protein